MKWSGGELSGYVADAANAQSLLTQGPSKKITAEVQELIKHIATGIAQVHSTWQQAVRIKNIIANGGSATPGGPIFGAQGVGSPNVFTEKFSASDITSAIDSMFPSKLYKVQTKEVKALTKALGSGFATTWNQWLSSTGVTGVLVTGGSSSHTPQSPGSLRNGVGQLPTLQQGFTGQVDFGMFFDNTVSAIGSILKQSPSKNITKELSALLKSISTGLQKMQSTWLQQTQLTELKVEGNTMIGSGTLIGGKGEQGRLT